MTSEQLLTLGFWAAALVAGLCLLWHGLVARRRGRQRLASWRELCLRLELTPAPAEAGVERVASGRQQGLDFRLRDTGVALLLEVPLPGPVLPPGVLLLSARAQGLRPRPRPRPLRLRAPVQPPEAPAWFTEARLPLSRAEASPAFLEEAHRAAQAFAPLRVEADKLVQALPGAALPSVADVRDAVRALHAAGQHWREQVEAQGLPRVEALPEVPPPLSLLAGVLKDGELRRWVLVLNAGIPLTVAALWREGPWAFFGLLALALLALFKRAPRHGRRGVVLGLMALATTFAAPWFLVDSLKLATSPGVLPVREASAPEHRQAHYFRFDDAELRVDLGGRGADTFVPVLPVDWRPGELVTVWAVRPPPGLPLQGRMGGAAMKLRRDDRWALIDVARERGLAIHAHAVFLDMSFSPDRVLGGERLLALFFWGLPNALWLGVVLVRWRRVVRESRRVLDA